MNAKGAVTALAVAAALAAGCTRAGEASGGGDKVNFCVVYKAYDELDAPPPSDPDEVLRYAEGVVRLMRRVDPDLEVDEAPVPAAILRDVTIIEKAMQRFGRRYDAATTSRGRLAAESALATDEAFARANRALTAFATDRCRRRVSNPVVGPPTTRPTTARTDRP